MTHHAHFETDRAAQYMQTLCKHFGRKVEVACDDSKGWVQFPFGRCDMHIDNRGLALQATAKDEPALATVVQIMTSHLERYAFRENPRLDWHQTTD